MYDDDDDDYGNEGAGGFDDDGVVPLGKKRTVKYRTRAGTTGEKERIVTRYRACMVCKLISSEDQFLERGCPNCPFLELMGNRANVMDCTSSQYRGMIAAVKPELSWAARMTEVSQRIPACYAVHVMGELPERYADELRTRATEEEE